jgi:hypothetical protein
MRMWVAIVAVGLSAPADAKRVMRPPSIAELCRGPATWAAIAKCARDHGGQNVNDDAPGVLQTITDTRQSYLFAKDSDGRWFLAHPYPKTGYIVLERTTVKLGGQAADRIEARYELDLGGNLGRRDHVLQKIAIMCRGHTCRDLVYECTRTKDGRAVETFLGHIEDEHGGFRVDGDRSQTGQVCL